jgi:hypothetical protein
MAGVLLAAGLVGLLPGARAHDQIGNEDTALIAKIDKRVQAWQPTPEERRLDDIAWAKDLRDALRARLYGLLALDARPAPFDRDLMTEVFGFQELVIPGNGSHQRLVQVAYHPVAGGMRLAAGLDCVTLKRRGVWHHERRNRTIARLARAPRSFFTNDGCQGSAPNGQANGPAPGVLVLVENVEHGLALAKHLRGWPLLTDGRTCERGLSDSQKEALRQGGAGELAEPLQVIATSAVLGRSCLDAIDVLIRADGGVGPVGSSVFRCRPGRTESGSRAPVPGSGPRYT